MCKKLILLTSFVLVLGFVNGDCVANVLWTGGGADNLWTNPANWEGNKAPSPTDWVNIEAPGAVAPNGPLIQDGMSLEIDGMANEMPGEPTLTITGGTLIITGWGIWWGDAGDCVATCNMSGGTMSLTGSTGIHEFGWGGARGIWNMTGGTCNAGGVVLSTGPGNTGELYLHGGTYNVGTSRADRGDRFGGGLVLKEGGMIDIGEGTLVLDVLEGREGDYTQYLESLMVAGQITAFGGAGVFEMDFDGRNPGKITVTAVAAGKAYNPDPADGAYNPETWANLSWTPAASAVSHDVYIGDTYIGNQADTFFLVGFGFTPEDPYPGGLVAGTTYSWRIDEVEADGTVHKGDVWSFTVPPRTAYNPNPADVAESVDLNAELSWSEGLGSLFHNVYFGDDYDTVSAATGAAQQAATTYTPGPLDGEKVYYWRVDEDDVAAATHKGDVWTFTTAGAVGNPQPANGATGVQMVADLGWTPADNATSHEVYLGTDKDAVRNATTASPEYLGNKALGSESHDPGKLAWNATYYWRADAVYPTGAVKGPVWSFTTADFITVDDFEGYSNVLEAIPGAMVWDTWWDGWFSETNGSAIGHTEPYRLPMELTIVHGGAQSVPYYYDNNLKNSEATMTLVYPRDWTEEGVGVLSLWFRGKATNDAEQMYVALNGVVVNHANANATQVTEWEEWTIPLQDFAGVDLTNVDNITIGFGIPGDTTTVGGSGEMYFDDIRLLRPPDSDGWTYTYTGDEAAYGAPDGTAGAESLDGTWDHDNGSDEWDGTGPGAGMPGGAVALIEDDVTFLRIQDTGDPRDYGNSDPTNRKVYLTHLIDSGLDGARLEFRARVTMAATLDDKHPDGGGGVEPWPAGGIGYHIRDHGKGMFGIAEAGLGIISFSLAKAGEPDFPDATSDMLVMNNLVGDVPSADVDTGDAAVASNMIAVADVTQWHTFTIDIAAGGAGTHIVSVSVDGGPAESFDVTTGDDPASDASHIAVGSSGTGAVTAFDVDYISVK